MLVLRLHLHNVMHCIVIFNARKPSLRRLCFYTCLSVILFTGEGGQYLGRYPSGPGTPPCRTRYTPRPGTPPGQVSPGTKYPPQPPGTRYTPLQVPPQAVHAGRYGQQAGGTHPTGMHSCSIYIKN